jgi:hypothetical protein
MTYKSYLTIGFNCRNSSYLNISLTPYSWFDNLISGPDCWDSPSPMVLKSVQEFFIRKFLVSYMYMHLDSLIACVAKSETPFSSSYFQPIHPFAYLVHTHHHGQVLIWSNHVYSECTKFRLFTTKINFGLS